jgi:hypothetical protein
VSEVKIFSFSSARASASLFARMCARTLSNPFPDTPSCRGV